MRAQLKLVYGDGQSRAAWTFHQLCVSHKLLLRSNWWAEKKSRRSQKMDWDINPNKVAHLLVDQLIFPQWAATNVGNTNNVLLVHSSVWLDKACLFAQNAPQLQKLESFQWQRLPTSWKTRSHVLLAKSRVLIQNKLRNPMELRGLLQALINVRTRLCRL